MAKQAPHPSGKVVSVRLDPQTEQRLNELSRRTGRSRGFYLRLALETMLPELEKRYWSQTVERYEEQVFMDQFRQIVSGLLPEGSKGWAGEAGEGHEEGPRGKTSD